VSFVYVDDTQLGADAFRSYLRNYQTLFQVLGGIDLIFLTTSTDRFAIGQKALARFGARNLDQGGPAVDLNRLLAHFPHRLLYEKRETRALNGAQMRMLAEDIHALSSPVFDRLYEVWKRSGEDGLRAECAAQREALNPPKINLTSCVLEYDYDLFGTLHAANSRARPHRTPMNRKDSG